MSEMDKTQPIALLKRWDKQFHKLEKAHFSSATACRLLNYSLGIPLLIVTVVIASEIFGLLEKTAEKQYSKEGGYLEIEAMFVISCSLLAPILAALQTFLRFPERAEQHKNAANAFGELRKKTQSLILRLDTQKPDWEKRLEEIIQQENKLKSEYPSAGTFSLFAARRQINP